MSFSRRIGRPVSNSGMNDSRPSSGTIELHVDLGNGAEGLNLKNEDRDLGRDLRRIWLEDDEDGTP